MFTEAQNAAIVRTELDFVFYQELEYDAVMPTIATAQTAELFRPQFTTHAAEVYEVYGGVGLYTQTAETQTVPLDTPKVTNKVFVNVLDWTKGVELSKNMFDDNMHGVWARVVQDMARKAKITQDFNAFGLFRNGFTTTLTADGVAVFGTHTLIKGGTYTNFSSGAGSALSDTSLYTAIVSMRQQPDQSNVVMGNVPAILLVGSANYKLALQLVDSALVADSATNAINVYRSAYGIKVLTSPWLDAVAGGSDTAWFLLARNHTFTRLIRQGIETDLRDWRHSNNRSYFYQANYRESYYVPDYVGSYGMKGV